LGEGELKGKMKKARHRGIGTAVSAEVRKATAPEKKR